MYDGNIGNQIGATAKVYAIWAISGLFDAAFLTVWVFLQWSVNRAITSFEVSGFDKWIFVAFQVLFGVMTLAPIAIYTYKDVHIMWIQAQREIQVEKARTHGQEL